MSSKRVVRPRSEDDDAFSTYLGIGSVQGVSDHEPDEPPGIWPPEHRSGSRFGGWKRQPINQPQRVIGFRKP